MGTNVRNFQLKPAIEEIPAANPVFRKTAPNPKLTRPPNTTFTQPTTKPQTNVYNNPFGQ
jgi:hypothetical protein